MLESLGYEVVAGTDSREALEVFRAQPERFDLVITDQTMPQLTGDKLAREILRLRPEMPIILCTGMGSAAGGGASRPGRRRGSASAKWSVNRWNAANSPGHPAGPGTGDAMASILIIDDDELMVSSLALMVRRLGHGAASAGSLREGLRMAAQRDFDVVFLDVRMPDGNGLEALPGSPKRRPRRRSSSLPVSANRTAPNWRSKPAPGTISKKAPRSRR